MALVEMWSDEFRTDASEYDEFPALRDLKPFISLGCDLSEYQTAAGAAKALHAAVVKLACLFGHEPDEVTLSRPEDDHSGWYCGKGNWGICWEGGPYEWAIGLRNAEGSWGYVEPGYSFSLSFYQE